MSEQKHRILVVDDEPAILKIVSKRLELSGFEVSVSMDGNDALVKVQSVRPDLIILDVMLPGMNGFDICKQLKQDPATKEIPIVLFTAKESEQDYWTGMSVGADAYLTKPHGGKELELLVSRLVQALKSKIPPKPDSDQVSPTA